MYIKPKINLKINLRILNKIHLKYNSKLNVNSKICIMVENVLNVI